MKVLKIYYVQTEVLSSLLPSLFTLINSFSMRYCIVFCMAALGSKSFSAARQVFKYVQFAYRSTSALVDATPVAMISNKARFIPGISPSPSFPKRHK